MKLKAVERADFRSYKKPAMRLVLPDYCYTDASGIKHFSKNADIDVFKLITSYVLDDVVKAVVFDGTEPFDSYEDIKYFIKKFREITDDTIIIYSQYDECALEKQLEELSQYSNIIVKFGKMLCDSSRSMIYDDVLGVVLSSDNQYAKEISKSPQ